MLNNRFKPFPVLETERVQLRKLDLADAGNLYEYQSNKDNFKYVDMPVYTELDEATNYINKMNNGIEEAKWVIWAIADKETSKILGTISIWNISVEQRKAELGYGLFNGNRGKGLMSESLNKVLAYGFSTLGLETIDAYTSVDNIPSIRLLERNYFLKDQTITEESPVTKNMMEMVVYQMKKEDFQTRL